MCHIGKKCIIQGGKWLQPYFVCHNKRTSREKINFVKYNLSRYKKFVVMMPLPNLGERGLSPVHNV